MTLWRVRATVDDRPGYLSVLTASLALRSVNILSVQVHATEAGAVDEFLIDAPESLTADQLVEAIRRGRGREPWVARADARGLIDEPTRALGAAAMVAADPSRLEQALASLLGDCEVSRNRGALESPAGFTPTMMVLADPSGGALVARRDEPAFTPAEFARAQALVQVARPVLRPPAYAPTCTGHPSSRPASCCGTLDACPQQRHTSSTSMWPDCPAG